MHVERMTGEATFGPGAFHVVASARPGQVRFERSEHREHVEEQPADGIGRIVHDPPTWS